MENQFSKLKVSKTIYLSEEELAQIENNENNENNNNNDNLNPANSGVFAQKENMNNDNLGNANISNTNNEPEEEKNIDSNILENNEFAKLAKNQYVQDNNNEENNELNIATTSQKRISNAHNITVLKIEDEENIQLCPDFISGFLNKFFG